jgi:uncharacterized protein involved in exopolysaccharide biosynthesis
MATNDIAQQGGAEKTHTDQLSLNHLLLPMWERRKLILVLSFIAALATLAVNYLFIDDYFKATASLLPSADKGKLSGLGQFAEFAALAGVNVPGSEVSRLYPSIIGSETILRNVVQRKYSAKKFPEPVNLVTYLELDDKSFEKNIADAIAYLRGAMSTSHDARTGIVTLTLIINEPQLAADVLNAVIEELDHLMRTKKASNASEQVNWIDVRLRQVEDSLRIAEEILKNFREKNRRVGDSPELLLKQERLLREVQVNSAVFIELKKQFELSKLEEIKNMTIVNVLDQARAPVMKVGPRRKTNAAVAFILTALFSSAFIGIRKLYGKSVMTMMATMKSGTPT